jgi:hypothetical protein
MQNLALRTYQTFAWTFTLNTESSYNWEAEEWSVPVNFQVAKLVVVDKQPISPLRRRPLLG